MSKCEHEHAWNDGSCCCNCVYQCSIKKHPWNKDESFKGSIRDSVGYGCAVFFVEHQIFRSEGMQAAGDLGSVQFSDRKHGMCEMHEYDKHRFKVVEST